MGEGCKYESAGKGVGIVYVCVICPEKAEIMQ